VNSEDVVANHDNMIHHHVLEVVLEDISLPARGTNEMITEGFEI
jgi:hypothetical protein